MTELMTQAEVQRNIFPKHELNKLLQHMYTVENTDKVDFSVQNNSLKSNLNFKGRAVAKHIADTIMTKCD